MPADFQTFGFSNHLSPELRAEMERQLVNDLVYYGVAVEDLVFDWSKSIIEGHEVVYKADWLENYSGIEVFDSKGNLVADGWTDFVADGEVLFIYWDVLDIRDGGRQIAVKKDFGIPDHIWNRLPEHLRYLYEKQKMKKE